MKLFKKKLISLFTVFMIFLQLIPYTANASTGKVGNTEDGYVVIAFEGLTLGQGYYVEPTLYSYGEIAEILDGSVDEDSLTSVDVTNALLKDKGISVNDTEGNYDMGLYLSTLYGVDKGEVNIPQVLVDNGVTADNGNSNQWLGEFDYSSMSGWMFTLDDFLATAGATDWYLDNNESGKTSYDGTHVIRWMFTLSGFGSDLGISSGWGNEALYEGADKGELYKLYAEINKYAPEVFAEKPEVKRAALSVMETLDAPQASVDSAAEALLDAYNSYIGGSEENEEGQDVSAVLNPALAKLAATVTEPNFGTSAGEWSVLSLARGGYYELNNSYFSDYYDRIVKTVNKTAASVALDGKLHKVKSTENSRLILALAAIGKDATKVGDYNIVEPLSDFTWVKKQGLNGPVFALIALDTYGYQVADTDGISIRTNSINYILSKEIAGGGWALSGKTPDPDMTSMALQALAPYFNENTEVKAAVERGIKVLSNVQNTEGGYASWGTVNAESIAQVIVALTSLGINPDTDSRFIKNGSSPIDAIMKFYDKDKAAFKHVLDGKVDAMATDQSVYALVAYSRFINGEASLYDMSDVKEGNPPVEEEGFKKVTAILSAPAMVKRSKGTTFNVTVSLSDWDSTKDYKLMDAIMIIPEGIKVTNVTMGSRAAGGNVHYYLEEDAGKLRIAYYNDKYENITLSGTSFPVEYFTVSLEITDSSVSDTLNFALSGMSFKINSDSTAEDSMHVIDTASSSSTTKVELKNEGKAYAYQLYAGDGVDLIPDNRQAVAVLITENHEGISLTYTDGTELKYSPQLTEKTGVNTYVAMFSTEVALSELSKIENYKITEEVSPGSVLFGDGNYDGVVNAQDALDVVNAWLRKSDAPEDDEILAMNINGDSRINTFDTLGVVDYFVNGTEPIIVSFGTSFKAN